MTRRPPIRGGGFCLLRNRGGLGLSYQTASEEVYIDGFNPGKLLTKGDCIHYLVRGNYDLREEYLTPISPRRMLVRICGNLHQIYNRLGQKEDLTRLQRYIVALSK